MKIVTIFFTALCTTISFCMDNDQTPPFFTINTMKEIPTAVLGTFIAFAPYETYYNDQFAFIAKDPIYICTDLLRSTPEDSIEPNGYEITPVQTIEQINGKTYVPRHLISKHLPLTIRLLSDIELIRIHSQLCQRSLFCNLSLLGIGFTRKITKKNVYTHGYYQEVDNVEYEPTETCNDTAIVTIKAILHQRKKHKQKTSRGTKLTLSYQ